jgi:hypothetical protein
MLDPVSLSAWDEEGAVEQMRATFKSKGLPTTNVRAL